MATVFKKISNIQHTPGVTTIHGPGISDPTYPWPEIPPLLTPVELDYLIKNPKSLPARKLHIQAGTHESYGHAWDRFSETGVRYYWGKQLAKGLPYEDANAATIAYWGRGVFPVKKEHKYDGFMKIFTKIPLIGQAAGWLERKYNYDETPEQFLQEQKDTAAMSMAIDKEFNIDQGTADPDALKKWISIAANGGYIPTAFQSQPSVILGTRAL